MNKAALVKSLSRRSLQFGDFTLASGAKSKYYLDCRKTTLSPDVGLVTVGIEDAIRGVTFDAIGGPCVGADPIVGAFLHAAGLKRWQPAGSKATFKREAIREIRGFLIRKEAKEHGVGGLVIGPVREGDRCIIVEDVATSGGSLLRAVDAIEEFGCKVVKVVVVVDRLQGTAEKLKERKIDYSALLTIEDFDLPKD